MRGGEAVVEALRREQARDLFGLIGSGLLPVFDALHGSSDMRYIGVRHEACGVYMADAYARISGQPGVMLAGQYGPGCTNLVTGLAQALLAHSPVVALAGAPELQQVGRDSFQEVDQQSLLTPVTKRTWTCHRPERIPEYVRSAFRLSLAGRRGPVAVNFPGEVLAAPAEFSFWDPPPPLAGPAPDPALLADAARLLGAAERPLILAGAGVKWARAHEAVMRLAEQLSAPIVASAGHGDVVPNDHPLFAGQIGPRGNAVASGLALQADVILALGTRLGANSTLCSHDYLSATARLIHVDVDPFAIGRYFPIHLGVVGDAHQVADGLCALLSPAGAPGSPHAAPPGGHVTPPGGHVTPPGRADWTGRFQRAYAELWSERARAAEDDRSPLTAASIFGVLRATLPRETIFTLDAGIMCRQAHDLIRYYEPPALITPLDFGLLGFAYAAGLGAKVAAPDRPVVTLIGDGGFGMTMAEIGTAVAHGLNTICIVMNNGCWGALKAGQRDLCGGRFFGVDLHNPRFDLVAQAFGARGVRVENRRQLAEGLAAALRANQPTVIEVPTEAPA